MILFFEPRETCLDFAFKYGKVVVGPPFIGRLGAVCLGSGGRVKSRMRDIA